MPLHDYAKHQPARKALLDRREFIRVGGLGVAAYALGRATSPAEILAQAAVNPRNTATACIFIKLAGGPSHLDTFSVKEGPWTPADWAIDTQSNITLPRRLFPRVLDRVSPRLSIAHSVQGWWDLEHWYAEYRLDTAHEFNYDRFNEWPALGAVAAMEYQERRRPGDILPGFVSLAGVPLAEGGFLAPPHKPFPVGRGWGYFPDRLVPPEGLPLRCEPELWDVGFYEFYEAFCRGQEDVVRIFQYSESERAAYGGSTFGDACLVAGNLLTANKGARFIYITYGQYAWDHHADVYPTLRDQAPAFDIGFTALVERLANTPSPESPGQSLLDQTLIVAVGEFGRTPPSVYGTESGLNTNNGRDHYANAHFALFAGGGVQGRRNIGVLNADGSAISDPGWWGAGSPRPAGPNIRMEDIGVTIYSALGINWTKETRETFSGEVYQYIQGGPQTEYKEIRELFE